MHRRLHRRSLRVERVHHPEAGGAQRHEEPQRVPALGHVAGAGAVERPHDRADEGQAIGQRIRRGVVEEARQRQPLGRRGRGHDPGEGQRQAAQHQRIQPLPAGDGGTQHGEAGPQVIHHADLDGLVPRPRETEREHEAQLITDEQRGAQPQVAPRQLAQRAARGQQQQGGQGEHHRRRAGPAEELDRAARDADGGAPEQDGDQAEQRGALGTAGQVGLSKQVDERVDGRVDGPGHEDRPPVSGQAGSRPSIRAWSGDRRRRPAFSAPADTPARGPPRS